MYDLFELANELNELRSQPLFGEDAKVLEIFFVFGWPDECEAVALGEEGFELFSNLVLVVRTLN